MPEFRTVRRVRHAASDMFDLVADVERYPEFVPLCQSLRVRGRTADGGRETVTATMTVAYKLLQESFTSRIVLDRAAREIRVSYIDGPFRHLENVWTFAPLGEEARLTLDNFRVSVEAVRGGRALPAVDPAPSPGPVRVPR